MQTVEVTRREKLAVLIQEAGSQAVLSEKIEKAPAQISQWLNASINSKTGKPRVMSNAIAREIEAKIGKPQGWMDQPINGAREGGGNEAASINLENNPEYPPVRRVKFKLSAGASGFGVEYDDEEGAPIVFQRQWYEGRGLRPDKLFAVKVANGSMEPGLHHDDTVVVNTESTKPKDGAVFAVNYEGELVIKRLVRDSGQWWLSSDNANQQRYPRKMCDEYCVLIGEIVHKQSERI